MPETVDQQINEYGDNIARIAPDDLFLRKIHIALQKLRQKVITFL